MPNITLDGSQSGAQVGCNTAFGREKQALFELHQKLCCHGLELMKRKNADYSKADPLGNFFVAESLQACTAEVGIIVRMSDKLSRINSILAKGQAQVAEESINDTIVDLINYSVLLAAVIQKKMQSNPSSSPGAAACYPSM